MVAKRNLVIQTEAEMLPLTSSSPANAKTRSASFLNPTSYHATSTPATPPEKLPPPPALARNSYSIECCPSSLPKWREWFSRLEPAYGHLWKNASIYDALKISLYTFSPCHHDLVVGFLPFWSHSSNTFRFPFGEATLTLQDVAILGGLPVLGESARQMGPPSEEHEDLSSQLAVEHRRLHKQKAKKASYGAWIDRFMEEDHRGGPLEHVAFLAYWLGRYLFPSYPRGIVTTKVFDLAIRLSVGKRVALAPAILASVYRDLRILRKNAVAGTGSIFVWAPIHLLQLWIWERFPTLRPNTAPHQSRPDQPRALRWHDFRSTWKVSPSSLISSTVSSRSSFRWSPYRDRREAVVVGGVEYARCVLPAELLGLDCVEQYQPHRVAMQLGLDQDVPPLVPRANATWDLAWRSYDGGTRESTAIPAVGEVGVTLRYWKWWRGIPSGGVHVKREAEVQLPGEEGIAVEDLCPPRGDEDDDDDGGVYLSHLFSSTCKGGEMGSGVEDSWDRGSVTNSTRKKRKGDSSADPIIVVEDEPSRKAKENIPEFAEKIMRNFNSLYDKLNSATNIVAELKTNLG